MEGLNRILNIKASLNRGLSEEVIKSFSNIIPVERSLVEVPDNIDPN
jgi:hypothetical protein